MWQLLTRNLFEAGGYVLVAISFVILMRVKKWFEGKKFFDANKMLERHHSIRELLIECRVSQDADRIKLFQFHNGDYYVSGESVMKWSMTHAVMRTGIAYPDLSNSVYSSVPTSYINRVLQVMNDSGHLVIDVDRLEDDQYLKHIFVAQGVKKALLTVVTDAKNNWVGFLMCTWMTDREVEHNFSDLAGSAVKIGNELTKK